MWSLVLCYSNLQKDDWGGWMDEWMICGPVNAINTFKLLYYFAVQHQTNNKTYKGMHFSKI